MNESKRLLRKVCEVMEEKKGHDLVILDISKVSSFADYFVVCHGFNTRQNQAIVDAIRERLKKEDGVQPSHVEGYDTAEWILLDYFGCVVHVFSPEARAFYKLERLWDDGIEVEPEALIA